MASVFIILRQERLPRTLYLQGYNDTINILQLYNII